MKSLRAFLSAPVVVTARVNRRPDEVHACYRALWRQVASYLDDRRGGIEIVEDRPGELLVWRSRHGAGRVAFQLGSNPDTTDVTVELEATLLTRSRLRRRARADLERFTQHIVKLHEPTSLPVVAPPPRPFAFPRP